MTTVFNVLPIHADESLSCYLLRLATSESVSGIRGLVAHMGIGASNASLNRNIEKLATFTKQSVEMKAGNISFTQLPQQPIRMMEIGTFFTFTATAIINAKQYMIYQ